MPTPSLKNNYSKYFLCKATRYFILHLNNTERNDLLLQGIYVTLYSFHGIYRQNYVRPENYPIIWSSDSLSFRKVTGNYFDKRKTIRIFLESHTISICVGNEFFDEKTRILLPIVASRKISVARQSIGCSEHIGNISLENRR